MDLKSLRYFVAVAEARSVGKAAERLHMAQPPLSVQIRNLEAQVGTPLFLRESTGMRLTDAGGRPVTALPGASTFDSATSFGLIRGGHLDMTVLGGLEVDAGGHLANWMIPGKIVPGMGGAMDLASGARRVVVAMQHTAKGKSKIVVKCRLPVTSVRPVDLVVTELAVIAFPEGRATLLETAPGIGVADVRAATEAELSVSADVRPMPFGPRGEAGPGL